MKFLCDANVGSIIARALESAGHDVVRSIVAGDDADDRSILARAVAENRVLVTCDRDFGELIYRHRIAPPPAVIYIRFEPQDVRAIMPRLMAALESDALLGQMTVIGAKHDRRTLFPTKSEK